MLVEVKFEMVKLKDIATFVVGFSYFFDRFTKVYEESFFYADVLCTYASFIELCRL